MSVDLEAYHLGRRVAPQLSEAELQYALLVARAETYYGRGWKIPGGKESNNWGAVQGAGPAGFFEHTDHHADGTAYIGKFKRYLTPDQGFQDVVRILYTPRTDRPWTDIRVPLAQGDAYSAVAGQRANGYFELALDKYRNSLANNYEKFLTATKAPRVLSFLPKALQESPQVVAPSSLPLPSSESPATSFSGPYRADLPSLRVGCHGSAVRLFFLLAVKINTGVYLPEHVDRVRTFQQAHKLKPDGIVGPITWGVVITDRT